MDAGIEKSGTGSRQQCIALLIAAFFALADNSGLAAQDGNIRIRGRSFTLKHSLKNEPQQFEPIRWDVQSSYPGGCLVEWEALPFSHTDDRFEADCELSVRVAQATPRSAGWSVSRQSDATSVASGKRKATVSVRAASEGEARIEMILRFRQDSLSRLAAGKYQTTVVGTITGL